jgi:hypothetical protein
MSDSIFTTDNFLVYTLFGVFAHLAPPGNFLALQPPCRSAAERNRFPTMDELCLKKAGQSYCDSQLSQTVAVVTGKLAVNAVS